MRCRSHQIYLSWLEESKKLGGGLKDLLFSTLPDQKIQFDTYFSTGSKPTTGAWE